MSRTLNLSALAAKAESGNNSSVRRIEALNMNIDDLLLEEPFKSLFPIRDEIKEAIKSHMQEHGYDESKPVDVWKRPSQDGFEYVLVDGFTRARAAKEIGKLTVTAYLHDFASVDEARNYAIHTQRDRRNLSDAEIMSFLSLVDKKVAGFKGDSPLAPGGANAEKPAKTAHRTAEEIGTSARKIERARKVSADPEMAAAVKNGELTINKGYNTIRDREKRAAVASTAKSQEPDRQNEGDASNNSVGPAVELSIQAAMLERLRHVLGNGAELIFDETGESGRISLWFEDHDRLNEILDLICSRTVHGRDGVR